MKTIIEEERENITCVGFCNDSAVFVDECGEVFYKSGAKGFYEIGEPTNRENLKSIDELDADDQQYIYENLL